MLDQMIENFESRVQSENHDINSINWVAGLSDPGEMIGCGMYQELRRHANEADGDYQKRLVVLLDSLPTEHKQRITTAIRTAAINRAGLDTSNDRVNLFVAGEPAWHGLGVHLNKAVKSKQAIEHSGLGYSVSKRQAYYDHKGQLREAEGQFSIVRDDTGDFLSGVGSRYTPIQNREAFEMLDQVIGEHHAYYEAAGALHNGKSIFILARFPEGDFAVDGSDEVQSYILATNTHGYGKAYIFATNIRVVCANTLRQAMRGKEKGIGIAHTGNISGKIAEARRAVGIAAHRFEEHKNEALAMATVDIDCRGYFEAVLDRVLDVTQAQLEVGVSSLLDTMIGIDESNRDIEAARIERMFNARTSILSDIIERYDSERCDVGRGTAWSAFNAVTESADFGLLGGRYVGKDRESNRFESIIGGRADDVKQEARSVAMEFMKV